MFFSLHSMTCSISSLGGIMSGGDFVLPKIGRAFVRGAFVRGAFVWGGFCPGLLDGESIVPLLLASYWCLVLKLQLGSVAHSPLLVPHLESTPLGNPSTA